MNLKRRALFGLSLAPLALVSNAVADMVPAKSVPLRGKFPPTENPLLFHPTDYKTMWISLPKEMGGDIFTSARMVEVEIGGKREYVMTFTLDKRQT